MNVSSAIREALESLASNKMRSGLTVLGIVIGVAAVIAMISIGRGAENTITSNIEGIGTNLLFVFSGGSERNDGQLRNIQPLTLADAEAMADPMAAPNVGRVAPLLQSSLPISFAGETTNVTVSGVTPDYEQVGNETMAEGQFIDLAQQQSRAAVAVIGPDTAETLFGYTEGLIGETIRISGQPFRIIGVLAAKGGSGFGSQDDRVLVPITTAQTRLIQQRSPNQVSAIQVQAIDSDSVDAASEEIAQILRTRHRTQPGLDDFTVTSQQSLLETASTITGVFTLFLGGIAAISLLVGGIGIMNIMLVSVTERTREIGLRKALGARRADILTQFLTESILLSLLGGIVGILLAWGITTVIAAIAAASNTPITPQIGIDSIALATLFSMGVGLLFGIYPANRAAGLQPVEALRFE